MKKCVYITIPIFLLLCQFTSIIPSTTIRLPLAYHESEIKKVTSYIGFIKFPAAFKNVQLDTCPAPRVYYGGNVATLSKTHDNDGLPLFSYACSLNQELASFDIVITLLDAPTSNTINSLLVPKGIPYIHYVLTKITCSNLKDTFTWSVQEKRDIGPFSIPQTALIISEDSDLIKGLGPVATWKKNSLSILLPTILYLDIDKNLFEYAHTSALLASLDVDGFHKKEEWVILQSPKARIFKTRIS